MEFGAGLSQTQARLKVTGQMIGIYAINRTSVKNLSLFILYHHQPWNFKQRIPTFVRPSVNRTQMFLLIVFFYWNLSHMNFRLECFYEYFITKRTVIWKIKIITAATYGLKSGGEFRCDGVDSCHECKFWLVPRSDLVDHLTSPHREGSVPVGQIVVLEFVWHDCECGNCEEKFEKKMEPH